MAVEKLQALRTNIQPDNTQTHHTEAACIASRSADGKCSAQGFCNKNLYPRLLTTGWRQMF